VKGTLDMGLRIGKSSTVFKQMLIGKDVLMVSVLSVVMLFLLDLISSHGVPKNSLLS
jgi:hypothetical protein